MDVRPAQFVREVDPGEPWDDVVNEAKALTWTHRCEHALIRVEAGTLLLVRGGADGLAFETGDGRVYMTVDGMRRQVTLLAWHTHPRPTGPSDHDREVLRMLGQASSVVYEMFGDAHGTRYRAFDREVKK